MAKTDQFSRRSITYLNKCEPVLRPFSERTLYYCEHDLSVFKSTVRTIEEQKEFVRLGVSRTMRSMHLPGANGKSRAVDLGIYICGVNVFKLHNVTELYEEVHRAAQIAARELNLNIRSGITWTNLNTDEPMRDMLHAYRVRKYKQGRAPFFDGPHFELYRSEYPDA